MPKSAVPAKQSKAAFVRSMPSDMPAKDVMRKASAQGLSVSEAYVYVIRSKSKAARKAARRQRAGSSGGQQQQERQLLGLALELGFGRTEQILSRAKNDLTSSALLS
jgi:hypothetical protein